MNAREIEGLMCIMNQTSIEFTAPDEDHNGEGGITATDEETVKHLSEEWKERR